MISGSIFPSHKIWGNFDSIVESILFRPPPPPPPPRGFSDPQLQIMCRYTARYYVKIMHVLRGVMKHIFPLSWGGGEDRTNGNCENSVLIL